MSDAPLPVTSGASSVQASIQSLCSFDVDQLRMLADQMDDPVARSLVTQILTAKLGDNTQLPGPQGESNKTEALDTMARKKAPRSKKALNAFTGYRRHIMLIEVLNPYHMKDVSKIVGTMWNHDPQKSTWALLSKTWSILRDQIGKENAPLPVFLDIVAPLLNIIPRERYMTTLGWSFFIDENNKPVVVRSFVPAKDYLDNIAGAPMVSIQDIIAHCQSVGFALEFQLNADVNSTTLTVEKSAARSQGRDRAAIRAKYKRDLEEKNESDQLKLLRVEHDLRADVYGLANYNYEGRNPDGEVCCFQVYGTGMRDFLRAEGMLAHESRFYGVGPAPGTGNMDDASAYATAMTGGQ